MFCERMKIDFDLKEIRRHGLEMFFAVLFFLMAMLNYSINMRMQTREGMRTARVARRTSNRNDYDLQT